MTQIRDVDLEHDAPAIVELYRAANPSAVVNVASWRQRERAAPARAAARGFVAERDGKLAGYGEAWRTFFEDDSRTAVVNVLVGEPWRRRGVGTTLFEHGWHHALSLDIDEVLTTQEIHGLGGVLE